PSPPTEDDMKFQVQEIAEQMIRDIAIVLVEIDRRDHSLADQARRAAQSVVLNLAEGNLREGKDGLQHFRIAAGSAAETRAALRIADAWRYADRARLGAIDDLLETVMAILWRLTHPR
ncbi:MAG TPA: four helix bundle protein, partial [bacterium]|nr:four helix bundle protein [bacterium]